MASRVQNLVPSAAAGKSSAVKRSNRVLDPGKPESPFAATLKRARTTETTPEPKETHAPAATKAKPRAAKPDKTDPAEDLVDDTRPLDSTGTTDTTPQDQARPADEETFATEGEAAISDDPAAAETKDALANGFSPLTAGEMLPAAQIAPAPSADVDGAPIEDVTAEQPTPQLTATVARKLVAAAVQAQSTDPSEAGDVDPENATDAKGSVDALAALGLGDLPGSEEDPSVLSTRPAIAPQSARQSVKPQAQPGVVEETAAADVPVAGETANAAKPVEANQQTQSGGAHPQYDPAQQFADAMDAKATPVSTTSLTNVEASTVPAPVAPAANSPAPATVSPSAPQVTVPEFAETNHDKIVTSLRSQLMPRGGAMEIRLDPPELGALQVLVKMQDGVMTASFQTSSDEATRLLSHSLGQLKHVLESAGITVDKLQVQQSPRNDNDTRGDDHHQSGRDDSSPRQEQQRKEMIKRMWRKLSGASDPLDLVA